MHRSRHDGQFPGPAREFLRADEVGQLLEVDRSTVYRMAERGGLAAVKVGRQWRFPTHAIERLLRSGESVATSTRADRERMVRAAGASRALIELAAELLGVMMIATDMDGRPVTELINPSPWFAEHAEDPDLVTSCLGYWKQLADDPDFDLRFHLSPLNVECARTFVRVGPQLVGMLFVGGIDPTNQDDRSLYRLSGDDRRRVLKHLPAVAAAISRLATHPPMSATREETW